VWILECFAEQVAQRTAQSACGLQASAVWSRDLVHSPISSCGYFKPLGTCSLWREGLVVNGNSASSVMSMDMGIQEDSNVSRDTFEAL
jgi:hypothetical protein